MLDNQILEAYKQGINAWQKAFNSQDAKGCADQYTEACVMEARPFGTFEGREAIQAFWQGIMDQGFKDVDYTDVKWEEHPEGGYILTASWTMNKAFGVVHREHWALEAALPALPLLGRRCRPLPARTPSPYEGRRGRRVYCIASRLLFPESYCKCDAIIYVRGHHPPPTS